MVVDEVRLDFTVTLRFVKTSRYVKTYCCNR